MRIITTLLLICLSDTIIGCEYIPLSFCETTSLRKNDYVMTGRIIDTIEHGIRFKVINVLKGIESRDTINIWDGTDFDCNGPFSMKAKGLGEINDTIIVILPKIDSVKNLWDVTGDFRRPDYFGYTPDLKVSNDTVYGYINGRISAPAGLYTIRYYYPDFIDYWQLHNNDCQLFGINNANNLSKETIGCKSLRMGRIWERYLDLDDGTKCRDHW